MPPRHKRRAILPPILPKPTIAMRINPFSLRRLRFAGLFIYRHGSMRLKSTPHLTRVCALWEGNQPLWLMLGGFHRRAARKDCVASPTSPPTLRPHRILFVASEAHPHIKTGGLGDVAGAMPAALHALGQDMRLLLPAYREALQHVDHLEVVGTLRLGAHPVRLLSAVLPGSDVPVWLVDSPRQSLRGR